MEEEEKDASSVLAYYKELLALRKAPGYVEVFTYGDFVPAYDGEEMLFAYHRKNENKDILIVTNFGIEGTKFPLEKSGKLLLKNREDVLLEEDGLILPKSGAAVVEC